MKKLKLKDVTVTALGGCVYCSKKDAAARFSKLGAKGQTELCHVAAEKANYILWVNVEKKNVNFLPLFLEDMELDDLDCVKITPLLQTAIIYHKRDEETGVCYIYQKEDDTVRQIKIFSDENMINNYCAVQGIVPQSIALCKIFSIRENRYISTCWSIYYENPNELDEDGEPQSYETLLPVDLADSDILAEIGVPALYSVLLKENETFMSQGNLYRVMKDENGLFITKDLFSNPLEKTREQELPSENEKKNEPKSACRILSLRQH